MIRTILAQREKLVSAWTGVQYGRGKFSGFAVVLIPAILGKRAQTATESNARRIFCPGVAREAGRFVKQGPSNAVRTGISI